MQGIDSAARQLIDTPIPISWKLSAVAQVTFTFLASVFLIYKMG